MKLDEAIKVIESVLMQVNATLPQHQQIQAAMSAIKEALESKPPIA